MKILKSIVWKLLSFSRLDENNRIKNRNPLALKFVQKIFESNDRRRFAEFIAPSEASLQFSKSVVVDKQNFTAGRMRGKLQLFEFLLSIFPEDARYLNWLEIGCCDGANLMVLGKLGIKSLTGFEINPDFLDAGRLYDEEAFRSIRTLCSSAEDFFESDIYLDRYDVIFSCAVLQHINPASNPVFSRIADLSRKYIVTIEAEHQCNQFHYPRNYCRVFSILGYKELKSQMVTPNLYPGVEESYIGYRIRIFQKE